MGEMKNTFGGMAIVFIILASFIDPVLSADLNSLVVPPRAGYVNDFSGIFSQKDRGRIEDKLKNFERKTGYTFLFVSLPVLDCIFQEQMCTSVVSRQWRLTKSNPNSVILFVSGINNRSRTYLGLGGKLEVDQTVYEQFISGTVEPLIRESKLTTAYETYIDFVIRFLHSRN